MQCYRTNSPETKTTGTEAEEPILRRLIFDFKKLQKAFWIWDKKEHLLAAELSDGQCCWNHIVGLPVKGKKEYPIFDYEKELFDTLLFPVVNNPQNLNLNTNISGLRNLQD